MSALAAGMLLDLLIGDPHSLPHPIRAIGRLITSLEKRLYRKDEDCRKKTLSGAVLWGTVCAVTVAVSAVLLAAAFMISPYLLAAIETVMTFYILAAGSLRSESMKVYDELEAGNIEGARTCLSMIVGRDTDSLDEAAIARAAVETVAENTSDGVIAPLLFTAFLTPAGGMLYKAVNTMDSMLGYHNERYENFGKVPARADDAANFIPSRLSALFMIAASFMLGIISRRYSAKKAGAVWMRDRLNHKSPNSAQTESACAGALGIRLGGTSSYAGVPVEKPYIGDDERPVENADIKRSLVIMNAAELIAFALIEAIMILAVMEL